MAGFNFFITSTSQNWQTKLYIYLTMCLSNYILARTAFTIDELALCAHVSPLDLIELIEHLYSSKVLSLSN